MKRFFIIVAASVLLMSCAHDKTIDGVTYRPYGLLNESTARNDSIQYQVSGWAVCSGILFFEAIVPPIYVFGFNLWEPVRKKSIGDSQNGVIN